MYMVEGDQLRGVINEANRLKAENERLRKELESVGTAAYLYGRDDLKAENAKLREELAKARDPQRIGGQADPSSFVYAIEQLREFRWQHATNDEDAIPYINNVAAAHERENAKLRERVEELEELLPENGRWFSAEVVEAYVAEIKKLRELVRDILRWKPCHRPCSRCERYEYPNGCEFERRRRELGVTE